MTLLKKWNKLVLATLLLGLTGLPQAASAQAAPGIQQTPQKPEPGKPYTLVEQMPQFDGGTQEMLKFISTNIRYPREAINKNIQGTTYVSFVIQPDGSVSQAEAHQKLGAGIEEEALRVINQMQGRWTPGKQDGKAVPVRFTLPIKFTLMNDQFIGINQPLTDSLNNKKPLSSPNAKRFIDKQPRYIGGRDALQKFVGDNLKYPASAKEGTVTVLFILDEKGQVSNLKIKESLSPEMDAEALRVVSLMSGNWEPAMNEGKVMKVGFYLPIRIKQTGGAPGSIGAAAPDTKIYATADQMPDYIGGSEGFYTALSSKLTLPADLRKKNLNARLVAQFVVEKDGTLSDTRITDTWFIKTIGPGTEFDYMDASKLGLVNKTQQAQLTEATLAAIKATSGQWTPGIRNGHEARVLVTLPVSFRGDAKAVTDQSGMKTVTILKPAPATTPAPAVKTAKTFTHQVVYNGDNIRASFGDGSPMAFRHFLQQNVKYPEGTDFQGVIRAGFRVAPDASVDEITVAAGTDPLLENEIRRVIKLMEGSWKPGTSNGKPYPTSHNLSFSFQIKDKNAPRQSTPTSDILVIKYK